MTHPKFNFVDATLLLLLLGPVSAALGQQSNDGKSQPEAPPKAARSVHLNWPAPDATAFYNEATVEQSTTGSYFMACGFRHGYFGIQEQRASGNKAEPGKSRKVVIFSVWDQATGNAANAVPEDQRVEVLFKADDVVARRFGGEGTGRRAFLSTIGSQTRNIASS